MIQEFTKGFGVALKYIFRPRFTVQYPEQRREQPPFFRGRHRLQRYADGLERCVGCALCAAVCPSEAIYLEAKENDPEHPVSAGERYAAVYEIHLLRCIFCGFCEEACPEDAIVMGPTGLPVVIADKCTACGDCVEACPLGLFVVMPQDHHLVVQCKNLLSGDAATGVCSVACNACGRCVADAQPGLISMVSGLATIDYTRIELENPKAIERCPTGAIVWIEGQQFPRFLESAGSEAA